MKTKRQIEGKGEGRLAAEEPHISPHELMEGKYRALQGEKP